MESIDIFDTAIFRKVFEPRDIFKLIENEVGKDFYNKRIEAEKAASKKYITYNIEQIYEFLPEFNFNYEIQVEFKYCYANKVILEMYNKNPDNYVFISDMYLSKVTLEELLIKNGYKNPRVYVSSECNAHKGDGSLFKHVKQFHNITRHYGDNYACDVIQAKENNIEPVFLPSIQHKNLNLPVVKNGLLKKYVAECYKYPVIERLAAWYTPLLYEFTKWCLQNRKPEQTLYFLSRDMYLPYLIAKNYFKANNIRYLYASRRSLSALILQRSNNTKLKDHICEILSSEEVKEKTNEDLTSCINYFQNMGLKNNDIIVDIGYSGTTQEALKSLNLELNGYYIQVNENKYNVNMKSFFNRKALNFLLPMEFTLSSDEDSIETYKYDKPYFVPDIEQRKQYAKIIEKVVIENLDNVKEFNTSVFDLEQLMIHIQYYPDDEILELFNSKIFTNRQKVESCIGFDKEEILKGNLIDLYNRSYAKPLFKKLLERDKDIAYLSKMLHD